MARNLPLDLPPDLSPGPARCMRKYDIVANELTETQVADRVVGGTAGGDTIQSSFGTNCVGVLGSEAVLVIDPLISPGLARGVEAARRRRTTAPVGFVVRTHHHTDHTWGASIFSSQGAAVVAHRACRERMAEQHPAILESRRRQPELADLVADTVLVLPQVTYDEALVIHLEDLEVELWHPGWGHTPGDTFLFLPEQRVAVCGDLVFEGYHYNYEDASVSGVRQGLKALEALDADVFIPGHGPAGGPEVLPRQAAYHDAVERIVTAGLDAGRDDSAIADDIRSQFPDYRLSLVVPSAVAKFRASRAETRKRGSPETR